MLGIVIATHGNLAAGLKDAADVIIGITENMACVSLKSGEDVQNLGSQIATAIEEVDQAGGVVILTDVVSASPYNQALLTVSQLAPEKQEKIYILGGVNLPMLLESINHQLLNTPVEQAAEAILQQGGDSQSLWHISLVADEEDEDEDF